MKTKLKIQEQVKQMDVRHITSAILERRTIIPRFRLPVSKEKAQDLLIGAIIAEIKFRKGEFQDSPEFRHNIELMAEWLTEENSKFGLLVCGQCGNGKSTWLKALQQLINYLEIPYANSSSIGMQIVKTCDVTELSKENMNLLVSRLCYRPLLGIDDLGIEPKEVMHYGNISSPIIRLIDKRYEEQLFTVITSNLAPDEITKVYGERTGDRLAEMMQVLFFDHGSYRMRTK